MYQSQAILEANTSRRSRSLRECHGVSWKRLLPSSWAEFAVAPIQFDIFREFEIAADRTIGYDEEFEPCYCASRYVLTDLRSDDDDVFYEEPVYAEALAAWRLRDDRWLIFRKVVGNYASGAVQSFFSFSDSMPR